MLTSSSRTRSLVLAGILALAAAALTALYVSRAQGGTPAAAHAPAATAPVLVATRNLAVGESLSQAVADGSVRVEKVAPETVSSQALNGATGALGRVVLQPIYAGEQVIAGRLGKSGTQGLGSSLAGHLRILDVSGDPNQLLAGTVQDGDHVDVVASLKTGTAQTPVARIVLHDLLVLHAPSGSAASSTAATASATVQLTEAQSQALFYVMKNGDWSFLLRPTNHVQSTSLPPVSAGALLGGSQ